MKAVRLITCVVLALSLSACMKTEAPTMAAPMSTDLSVGSRGGQPAPGAVVMVPQYKVKQVIVDVPRDLRVSEANVFFPIADIVWRGDARGDRYAQVASILEEGFNRGTEAMDDGRPVVVEVKLVRFHSLTEKTRYTFGGSHAVNFELTVRDAKSGAVVDGPRLVKSAVDGAGGAQAIAEEQAGRTMRVVIVEHIAATIARELSLPVALPADPVPTSQGGFQPDAGAGALW